MTGLRVGVSAGLGLMVTLGLVFLMFKLIDSGSKELDEGDEGLGEAAVGQVIANGLVGERRKGCANVHQNGGHVLVVIFGR